MIWRGGTKNIHARRSGAAAPSTNHRSTPAPDREHPCPMASTGNTPPRCRRLCSGPEGKLAAPHPQAGRR